MHGRDALGHADRPDGVPSVDDRHRRGQDLLAKGRGGPLDLGLPTGQRSLDFGTTRVTGAQLRRPGAVDNNAAGCVHDQDPPTKGYRGRARQRLELRAAGGSEEVGRGCGHQVCLGLGLGTHLRIHTRAEAQAQRDTERDDREQQYVGDCGQKPRTQAHLRRLGSVARQKPTPRTVRM